MPTVRPGGSGSEALGASPPDCGSVARLARKVRFAPTRDLRLVIAAILTGITAGLVAMALALLLHAIQHLAYGFDLSPRSPPESFLQDVTSASPERRALALLAAGIIAGIGWWGLARFGAARVSVTHAVGPDTADSKPMPFWTTIFHALLQEITVALGSPLGREVAPREMGTLVAQSIARRIGLERTDARILAACGAGAGLAAVYNVPLAGAIFVLEVLLLEASGRTVVLALFTSALATVTAWAGLGNAPQYVMPQFEVGLGLLLWSPVAGSILGIGAWAFNRMTERSERAASTGWHRIVISISIFVALGAAAGPFPELPGNGKGPLQLLFDGEFATGLIVALLLLKLLAIAGALRAGAAGGVLTPSMVVGALVAALLGGAWNIWLPPSPVGAYAVVGAAAFMGSTLAMPLTALVLMTELSHSGAQLIVPMALATGTAFATSQKLVRLKSTKNTDFAEPSARVRANM